MRGRLLSTKVKHRTRGRQLTRSGPDQWGRKKDLHWFKIHASVLNLIVAKQICYHFWCVFAAEPSYRVGGLIMAGQLAAVTGVGYSERFNTIIKKSIAGLVREAALNALKRKKRLEKQQEQIGKSTSTVEVLPS